MVKKPGLTFVVVLLLGLLGSAQAPALRVMKTGLGKGWIEGSGISCGITATDPVADTDTIATSCNTTSTTSITLTARNHPGSTFAGWGGDCPTAPGTGNACTVPMDVMRSVRARFTLDAGVPPLTDLSSSGINTFLTTGSGRSVNTAAEFVAALPREFRENWILMTRSESLQTGTTEFPRILLLNQNATAAFTLGLDEHSSYPGAHPNAIEYMQWDGAPDQKNFRFHEIIVARVPGLDEIGTGTGVFRFRERATRGVSEDDQKCFACHSTSNVRNRGSLPGTTGNPIGSVKFKNKPNWDTYDSWGGILGFNRDRIYKGSIEAASFRRLMNLWTWQTNEAVRSVVEQLALQPATARPQDAITRWDTPATDGGANDGHIHFAFDPAFPTVTNEPLPASQVPPIDINAAYAFNRTMPTDIASPVVRNGDLNFVVLQHPNTGVGAPRFDPDEGRATNFFNNLYIGLNPQRIVDEMSPRPPAANIFATGSVPIDVRPIALAIARSCISVSGGSNIGSMQTISGVTDPAVLAFFNTRNGLSFNDVYDDTRRRAQSMTRRKADIQKWNLDRAGDPYVYNGVGADPVVGLIDRDEAATDGIVPPTPAASKRLRQIRQEVFRRPVGPGHPDETAMGRIYVDREDDSTDGTFDNTAPISLYRYFLEPLGVPVDKWSIGVRGRSRTYSFADNFTLTNSYNNTFERELGASLGVSACADIMPLVTAEFARLPGAADTPTYTDIQRIFNKGCIECHGGLYYPPVRNRGITLDFTEDENPTAGQRRLWKSLSEARSLIGGPTCPPADATCTGMGATNVANSYLYSRITDFGSLAHPYDPGNLAGSNEDCPNGVMPCGGPPLSKTDIETIRRWIVGASPHTEGDPHIKTVDGVNYDFQSAGEFVLLRDDGIEVQVRQSAVSTAGPLAPDAHTGLSSCVSVNTAVAMRVGDHRVTYQPALDPERDKDAQTPRLQLRIDGTPFVLGANPIPLRRGGRIVPTSATGGLEIQVPGGTRVAVTPLFWEPHQVHFMQINVYHGRAVDGVMGAIAPNNWLPRLSNGDFLGPRPASLAQRHHDLYETFADSWRVDATSSLFYYEPGLNPNSFVVPGWPVAEAIACNAPPQPGVPVPTQPITSTIGQAQAEQLCSAVVDPERRDNCIQDVMATGHAVFAEAYLQSQRLDQRIQIAPSRLVSPAHNARVPATQLVFEWTPVPGTKDVDVTHYHCLWKRGERFDFNNCTVLSVDRGLLGLIIPPAVAKYLSPVVCLILFVALLLLALILLMRNKREAALLVLILALLVALVCWLQHRGEPTSVSIQNLEPGEIYRWKVVTDTKDGLVTESETHRFEVEK